jgi:hypothetical protein
LHAQRARDTDDLQRADSAEPLLQKLHRLRSQEEPHSGAGAALEQGGERGGEEHRPQKRKKLVRLSELYANSAAADAQQAAQPSLSGRPVAAVPSAAQPASHMTDGSCSRTRPIQAGRRAPAQQQQQLQQASAAAGRAAPPKRIAAAAQHDEDEDAAMERYARSQKEKAARAAGQSGGYGSGRAGSAAALPSRLSRGGSAMAKPAPKAAKRAEPGPAGKAPSQAPRAAKAPLALSAVAKPMPKVPSGTPGGPSTARNRASDLHAAATKAPRPHKPAPKMPGGAPNQATVAHTADVAGPSKPQQEEDGGGDQGDEEEEGAAAKKKTGPVMYQGGTGLIKTALSRESLQAAQASLVPIAPGVEVQHKPGACAQPLLVALQGIPPSNPKTPK